MVLLGRKANFWKKMPFCDGIAPKHLCAVALIQFELSYINRLTIKLHAGMVNDQKKVAY